MPRWVTQDASPVSAIRMEQCPPSAWNSVRHHGGMMSAISAERCPRWRGIRTKPATRAAPAALEQLRRVSSRSALRARALNPALPGASRSRHSPRPHSPLLQAGWALGPKTAAVDERQAVLRKRLRLACPAPVEGLSPKGVVAREELRQRAARVVRECPFYASSVPMTASGRPGRGNGRQPTTQSSRPGRSHRPVVRLGRPLRTKTQRLACPRSV
jgi:hypothetical protein